MAPINFDPVPRNIAELTMRLLKLYGRENSTHVEIQKMMQMYRKTYVSYYLFFKDKYPLWGEHTVKSLAETYTDRTIGKAFDGNLSAMEGVSGSEEFPHSHR